MTTPSIRMSQTGKILIGVLLAAAAIFFWVNFFLQNRSQSGAIPGPRDTVTRDAAADTAVPGAIAPGAVDADGVPLAPSGAVAVEVAPPLDVTTRDLVVSDLPFLVSEPIAGSGEALTTGAEEPEATGANRPDSAQRVTINPFSPVLVQNAGAGAGALASTPPQPVATADPIVEVAVPAAPEPVVASAPQPIVAPAPAALAPPSPRAQNLPRALPSGTLPSTPDILRSARVAPEPLSVSEAFGAPGVREPAAAPAPELGTVQGGEGSTETASAADLAPLGPSAQRTANTPRSGDPLAAGVTPLSAYLRDNNVSFTGSVLGPVSVGVFRSALSRNPVVIALGSSLPETDIVLTDLRGQQAQFTKDEATQTLTLNLRR